ncbi:MAG: prolyl oligopeptidase family serine peptidase [Actinomycetota bacterium]
MRGASDYPSAYARTKRFSLGAPRTFTVSPDGRRVLFLRSRAGDDPVNALWSFEVDATQERLLFDPLAEGAGDAEVSRAELDRRERVGERASGITAYSTDAEVTKAVFALGARLVLVDVETGETFDLVSDVAVDDPRLDPTGRRVAYALDGALHVLDLERADRVLADEDDPNVTWGLPEFVAAEEMDRHRGMWWSPDGDWLAAERSDVTPVHTWWIADPAEPGTPPRPIRYPQAGTDDAIVTLHVFDVRNGERVEVRWDRNAFPYLGRVDWSEGSPLTVLVVSRDQRRTQLLEVAPSGSTTVVREESDPEWVDLPSGGPTRLGNGRLVTIRADRDADAYRLVVGEEDLTEPGVQVRSVLSVSDAVLFTGSEDDPTQVHLYRSTPDGAERLTDEPGVHSGVGAGPVLVRISATTEAPIDEVEVFRDGEPVGRIASNAERPPIEARPRFLTLGERELRAALLLPGGREPERPLPVLMDPYGGPHFARVMRSQAAHLTSQWFADELGVAVLVVDGRGTPGRGPAWDRAVFHDFMVTLEDQVDALEAAANDLGFLDRSRVAMRGWSFGGYLSAMAVLRRPDVFHAAVAGAPVTDLSLYDTYYTERYLGKPQDEPEVYARNSIVVDAPKLERPLLLIHGMADDNVVVAHTLRLSAALFEHGRHHELAILPSATHRQTNEEVVLRLETDFLRRALRLGG